jgi:hypothetical protein
MTRTLLAPLGRSRERSCIWSSRKAARSGVWTEQAEQGSQLQIPSDQIAYRVCRHASRPRSSAPTTPSTVPLHHPLRLQQSLLRHPPPQPVTPRIFAVEFFFFSLLAKIRALPFLFLFPSLNLDLFQSSSGIRFGIPVCIKTLNTLCCLMHHAEPCISFDCFESANAFM